MHLYIAGIYNAGTMKKGSKIWNGISDTGRAQIDSITHILESYHYLYNNQLPRLIREDKRTIFLDSGAFSAFTKGVTIDIEEYIRFQSEWADIIHMASVLDAIGDANGTWANQLHLEQAGCKVIPCFHGGEPIEACRYYVANYDYISLGGMVGGGGPALQGWLDEVFTEAICDKDGYAKVKVHGFGMTSLDLMQRYPWYSVDSTSWVQSASFGAIVFPELKRPIDISNRSPARKQLAQHFSTLTKREQDYLRELAVQYELDLDFCAEDYKPRYAFNAYAFHLIGERMSEDHWRLPFQHRQRRFF